MENPPIDTPFKRFKTAAIVEGISYLLLLGIAMPLKYCANMPIAVRIAGPIHGIAFMWFLITLFIVTGASQWPFKKFAKAFIASLIPFGTFYLDRFLVDAPKMHHTQQDKKGEE